jgi:hypothetical protein
MNLIRGAEITSSGLPSSPTTGTNRTFYVRYLDDGQYAIVKGTGTIPVTVRQSLG